MTRWIFYLIMAGVLVGTCAWLAATPDGARWLPASASGLVILVGALGTMVFRRRGERAARTGRADSVEKNIALDARAGVFVDALVVGAALSACLWLFDLEGYAGVLLVLYLVVLIADFWLRYLMRLSALRR
jgi:hypothetical protein